MQINLCGKIVHFARPLPYKMLLAMKLTIFIMLGALLQVSAAVNAQRISLSEKNVSTTSILNKIQQQSGFDIFYKNNLVKDARINVELSNVSLETALKVVLDHQNLEFSIEDKLITIRPAEKGKLPQHIQNVDPVRIKGTVLDEEGKGLARATIQVLGKNTLTIHADTDGSFAIGVIAGDTALRVSYIGFISRLVKLEPGKTTYKIKLTAAEAKLKDVVVTGIFDKPKESFTGAVTVISKEQIKMFGNRNLLKTIANIDPSFNIEEKNNYGSDPNVLPNISVRGTSTLPTDLTNIQGTNVKNAYNLPLFILDGFEVSLERVMDMNQYDVESIVILKDASSTAAYGSRGANGVIVITSIKPVAGKLRVSYSAGINMEIPDFSSYNLLNSTQKLSAEKLGGLYTANDISSQDYLNTLYNKNLKAAMEGVNTNWLKVPTQTGVSQTHQLGLSGGDAEFRYTLTGSYNQITGAMKGSKRDNFNGGFSIMYLLKKVRFTNNLSVGFNNSANSPWGDFGNYILMNPYWSPYGDNGNAVRQYSSFSQADSPLNPAYNGSLPGFDRSKYTVVRNTTSVDWDIIKGLKWSNSLGYNRQIGSTDTYLSRSNTAFLNVAASNQGQYGLSNSYAQGYQVRSNVSYGTVINKSTLYGGINMQATEDKQNSSSILATGFSNDTQTDLSQAINVNRPSTSESTTRTVGASATVSYIYDSRFFADGNYNLTGGSSFGSQSRFGKFWSAGVGWTVSNERFMKDNVPQINTLRIRYNYGVTGNLNFAPYQSLSTYNYDRTALYRTLTGASLTGFANKDLQWQTTYQQNAGIDMNIFDNKLTLSANYYFKRTTNAITSVTLPYSHGFASYTENLGQINNYGSDVSASFFVIKNPGRKFYWSITAAASHNKNVLVKLSDALKKATATAALQNSTSSTLYQYVEGQSSDELYVVQSPGVDAATGKVLYLKADGTVTTDIAGVPKVAVGDGIPKINARLSTMVRVGQFTANVGFGGRFGGKKVNYTLLTKVENAYLRTNVDKRVFDLRWTKPGDVTAFKSISAQDATYPNTRFVFTENTILLNNVNLNYSLPSKWVKRLNMEQISVAATMSDLGYWSNIEQERGTAYPYTLKPSFTISAIF